MASVKYSGIITELKGTIGGVTFQKCGRSLSVRSNPRHKKASTQSAQNSRNQFCSVASFWRGLSNAQRIAYSAVASSYPTVDKWGVPTILSGYQLFIYLNRFLYSIGFPMLATAPMYAPFVGFNTVLGNLTLSDNICEASSDYPTDPTCYAVLYVSLPYNGSSYLPYLPTVLVCALTYEVNVPVLFGEYIMSRWLITPVVGQRFNWEVYSVSYASGQYVLENKGCSSVLA